MITKEMTIDDILGQFPQKSQKIAQELLNSGLHCVGCGAATWETLEAGAFGHGMSQDDLDDLVERLNGILSQAPEGDGEGISLSKRAAEKFQEILAEEGKPDWALRFGDRPGGCSGYEYTLDFSRSAAPEDKTFESHGVSIHVHSSMYERLRGCEIDYVEGLMGGGFKISNPNVRGSCGCGSSQSY